MSGNRRRNRRRNRRERELAAYRDGELSASARERLRADLDSDPELVSELRSMQSLGDAIRGSWSEGPPAPSVDFMIQSLRPELARIDKEREQRPFWQKLWDPLSTFAQAAPVGAFAGVTAAVVLMVWAGWTPTPPSNGSVAVAAITAFGTPSSVYDVEDEAPLLLYELEDGSTVIWALEDHEDDGITSQRSGAGGWV